MGGKQYLTQGREVSDDTVEYQRKYILRPIEKRGKECKII